MAIVKKIIPNPNKPKYVVKLTELEANALHALLDGCEADSPLQKLHDKLEVAGAYGAFSNFWYADETILISDIFKEEHKNGK